MMPRTLSFEVLGWSLLLLQIALAFMMLDPWLTSDSPAYLQLANSLANGFYGLWTTTGVSPDVLRPPGYPITLSVLIHSFGMSAGSIVVLQLALYLSAIALIFRYLLAGRSLRITFLGLCCVYPFGALYSSFIMAEPWCIFILAIIACVLSRSVKRVPGLAFVGFLCGLGTLMRTDLLFLPFFLAFLVYFDERGKKGLLHAGALILVFALVVAPYAYWNNRHFGNYVPAPAAAATGNSLYLATWQEMLPLEDLNTLYKGPPSQAAINSGIVAEIAATNATFGASAATAPFNPANYETTEQQIASSQVYGRLALKRIIENPLAFLRHGVRNLWALWNSSQDNPRLPQVANYGLSFVSAVVTILGLLGAIMVAAGAKQYRTRYLPILVIVVYQMLVHLPLHTEARYTAVVRPLLLCLGAMALLRIWQTIHSRSWGDLIPGKAWKSGL